MSSVVVSGKNSRTALVTLAVGREYRLYWRRYCYRGWKRYAQRHGYDLYCIEQPLDSGPPDSARPVPWQKLLILSQDFASRYDRVVWADADIAINPSAPCVVSQIPEELVGAVDEYSIPDHESHKIALQRLYAHWESAGINFLRDDTPQSYYTNIGLPDAYDRVVQTGLMVLSPRHHRELLEHLYHSYPEYRDARYNHDMRCTSHGLLKAEVVHWLDWRFNAVWQLVRAYRSPRLIGTNSGPELLQDLAETFGMVHFLHFAGESQRVAMLEHRPVGGHSGGPSQPAPVVTRRNPGPALAVPVVLVLFARPDTTLRVFEQLRRVRPQRLFLVADGPRPGIDEDVHNCALARAVVEQVDWDCDVSRLYSDTNLGTRRRVTSGLDRVFESVEQAIILEDDCVPVPAFFRFCQQMLERYRDDERIMTVSGNNFQFVDRDDGYSYYFSRYPHVWGWATWRRSWARYDESMAAWPGLRDSGWLETLFGDPDPVRYWSYIFQKTYDGLDTWDYQLVMSSMLAGALNILPAVNLVSNIGFGPRATHTVNRGDPLSQLPVADLSFPLRHPPTVTRDDVADAFTEDVMFSGTLRSLLSGLRVRSRHGRAGN